MTAESVCLDGLPVLFTACLQEALERGGKTPAPSESLELFPSVGAIAPCSSEINNNNRKAVSGMRGTSRKEKPCARRLTVVG